MAEGVYSDRLTEVQGTLDFLGHMFYTCVGVIQRDAPSLPLEGEKKDETWQKFEEQIKDMALQVAQTAKRMDQLIDSLPGVNSTEQQQLQSLTELELKNRQAAEELRQRVQQADIWLQKVKEAITEITKDKLAEYQ